MEHIKAYMKKIDAAVDARSNKQSKGKGLLAPKTTDQESQKESDSFSIIVDFVYGIRQAREEMKNG